MFIKILRGVIIVSRIKFGLVWGGGEFGEGAFKKEHGPLAKQLGHRRV